MALQDRVFSLETEYAITFYADHDRKPGSGKIVDVLMQAVAESHGTRAGSFLLNGSRLAHDVGHAEWSLPECRSGRELAIYDKAADHLYIETVVPSATQLLRREGFQGRVVVAKNNADPFGNTYGCHENYQMMYNADLLAEDDFVRYIAQAMIPFLATRLIFAGSGRIVTGRNGFRRRSSGPRHLKYEFSQRAGFIQTVVSRDTTRARPIFNLGREGESFAIGNYRRLHQIIGDATLSGWATWVKMGSTGLLLRMIEDVFVDNVPVLRDPVAAVRTINGDVSGQKTVPLQDGRHVTGLDIQWHYYDLADKYLDIFGVTDEDEALMEAWGKALEDFERDPRLLRDRADWAIKKQLLDKFLEERDAAFGESIPDRQIVTDLQAMDLRFHELSPEGLYTHLYPADTLLTKEEIQFGQTNPPPYTRARVRGEVVRLIRDCGVSGHVDGWMGASIREKDIRLSDPMVFDDHLLAEWDRPWVIFERNLEQNPENDELHYKLGKTYQGLGHHQRALRAFRTAAKLAPDRIRYIHSMAHTLLLVGLYEESAEWWEKYNGIRGFGRGSFHFNHNSLGDAYRLLGKEQKAIQAYNQALRERGQSADLANNNLALLHLKNDQTTSAETYFNKSLRQSSERLTMWTGLGAIQIANGHPDQGKTTLQNAIGLSSTFGLTPESARYFGAVVIIGLEADDGLSALRAALDNRTALAADGIYAVKPLLNLLAESPNPPREARQALALVENVQVQTNQPDPPDLPPMTEHVRQWLHDALNHPIKRIRRQAIEYLSWRLEDAERVPGLAAFVQRLFDIAHSDPDPDIRRLAVQMLANPAMDDMNVMDELITCLHDGSSGVRWAAQTSLENLSLPDPTPSGMVIFATPAKPREVTPFPPGRFFRRSAPPPPALSRSDVFDAFDSDELDDISF